MFCGFILSRQVHLNLVLRHGARNPGDDEIVGFNALAEKLSRIETLDDTYGWVKRWRFPVAVEDEGLLLPLGMREHYELGKRLRRLFPQAFPSYHPNVYSIRGTYVSAAGIPSSLRANLVGADGLRLLCGELRKPGPARARCRSRTAPSRATDRWERLGTCPCTCIWTPRRRTCSCGSSIFATSTKRRYGGRRGLVAGYLRRLTVSFCSPLTTRRYHQG